jgi:hypothetical protein
MSLFDAIDNALGANEAARVERPLLGRATGLRRGRR